MNQAIYCDLHRQSFWPWVWPTLMLILYFEFINFFYFFFQNWFPFFNKWQKQQSWIFFSIQLCDCISGTNFIFLTFLFRGKAWLSAGLNFFWVQKDWKPCGIFIGILLLCSKKGLHAANHGILLLLILCAEPCFRRA